MSLEKFYGSITALLQEYQQFVDSPVRRLAALISRYVAADKPGPYLAAHFCRDEWLKAPFNRTENFELHAHKVFSLADNFRVNSWVRNKTAKLTRQDRPIIVVEQDINTLAEESGNDFRSEQIGQFFSLAPGEFEKILNLYYPPTGR